jgi:putative hydrolase of the HAD superfamily
MAPVKALVFDLDDTLYPEASYVRSGFRAVAAWLQAAAVLPADQAFAWMESAFARDGSGRIFDHLLAACPSASGRVSVAQLVQVYRSHAPGIALYPHMADLLDEAKARSLRIAVISDGYLEAQRQKARALGLSRWAEPILFTDAWGAQAWKPNPMVFSHLQQTLGLRPRQLVYVGDNPAKDFQAPNLLGWDSIQLVLPGQRAVGRPVSQARLQVEGIGELRARLFQPAQGGC